MRYSFGGTLTQISNELGIPYKSLWRIIRQYENNPKLYLANIMNNRPQPTELTKISESISMFIDSRDIPFTTREIQNFFQVKIGISLKRQQIVQHLRKELKMSYRRVNSRPKIKDKHHKLMLESLFAVEVSSILSREIVIVSID